MSNQKNILMFVPYNYEKMSNAPTVRAWNMHRALKKYCNVKLVTGNSLKRFHTTIEYFVKRNQIDGVYIEGLASFMNFSDYLILNKLKKHSLILPFIRDIYWMYPETLNVTNTETKIWYKFTEYEMKWYLRNANALLFPSETMSEIIDFPKKFTLPPAGSVSNVKTDIVKMDDIEKNILYVGGFGSYSGMNILVKAMEYVVREHPDAYCTLVGYGKLNESLKNKKWIKVVNNASFYNMDDIISQSYITTIPRPITPYNDFSMPVKLFDYLSYAKPVVSTRCLELDRFINTNKVGLSVKDNPEDFADGIIYLLDNPKITKKMGKNALELIKSKHSWDHRAQKLLNIIDGL